MRFKVYKSDNLLIIYNGVLWGILAGFVGSILYILADLLFNLGFQIWIPIVIFIIAVMICLILVIRKRFTSVEVSDKVITILGRGDWFQKFSLAHNEVGTFIEIQGVLGIAFFVKRYLKINGMRYHCYNFSSKAFSRMSGEIEYLRRQKEEVDGQSEEFPPFYQPPYREIMENEAKKSKQLYLECVGVSAIMCVVWYLAVWIRNDWSKWVQYSVLGLLIAVFLVVPITLQMKSIWHYQKHFLHNIVIREDHIALNGERFDLAEIQSIFMTPVSYHFSDRYSVRRSLRIQQKDVMYLYYLGGSRTKEPRFEQYDMLGKQLVELCDQHHIFFILDL